MSKYTAGPWYFHPQGDANIYAINHYKEKYKSPSWLLVLQHNGEQLTAEQEANMRLIAAAPELLEALESLNEEVTKHAYSPEFEHMGPLVLDAREAIIKAKGDSHE